MAKISISSAQYHTIQQQLRKAKSFKLFICWGKIIKFSSLCHHKRGALSKTSLNNNSLQLCGNSGYVKTKTVI